MAIFCILSLVAAALTLLLPETRGQPLPLTISDIQNVKGYVAQNRNIKPIFH